MNLAETSSTLPSKKPWSNLSKNRYCGGGGGLKVNCPTFEWNANIIDGADIVAEGNDPLTGAMPPSAGDLGGGTVLEALTLSGNDITSLPTQIGFLTTLTKLDLDSNSITSVPSELAALTSLENLFLYNNQLTGVPNEFQTWGPSGFCYLADNPNFSCANVGAGTTCCTADTCGDTSTCFQG